MKNDVMDETYEEINPDKEPMEPGIYKFNFEKICWERINENENI